MVMNMIYNDEFVWLHFPKCAGSKIESLFREYFFEDKGIVQDIIDITDTSFVWHDSISQREKRDPKFSLDERTVICSIRNLPSWLESRYSFEFKRNPDLPHNPEMLLEGTFLEATGSKSHADLYAKKYIPEKLLNTGKIRFLRNEYFESDFKSIFGDYLDISIIPDGEYQEKVNASKRVIPEDIREKLYDNNRSVYDKCPYWQSVEKVAYGIYS